MAEQSCFHCGEPVPEGSHYREVRDEQQLAFCCPACLAVYRMIESNGLGNYYQTREGESERPAAEQADYSAFDIDDIQLDFTETSAGTKRSRLFVDGIHCSACTWLLEKRLAELPGVSSVQVQLHKQLASIEWDPQVVKLSQVFAAIDELGYRPLPYRASERDQLLKQTRRGYLGRIGVAGIASMQVGMFSIALYAGEFQSIDPHWRDLLRYFSLLLATVVVAYAAQPFFQGAWRSLRSGVIGMDVPVALAIALAYTASLWATFSGGGQVYFDSVCMFAFFLLLSRFLEFQARSAQWFFPRDLLPESALRCDGDRVERVSIRQLQPGDIIQVAAGETLPADGRVARGQGSVNESAFSGEFLPVSKNCGDAVLAGSINGDTPLDIEVSATRNQAVLHGIEQLADRALEQKPVITQMADRLSHFFVSAVLLLCALTAFYWWQREPSQALWVSLAVLVVSCPCALSLATPTALATALRFLQKRGVLVTRSSVIETLPKLRFVVFDKTGTLTRGCTELGEVRTTAGLDREQCTAIAVAMERRSSHPLARAFQQSGIDSALLTSECRHITGCGIEATIDGRRYRLGSAAFCGEWLGGEPHYPDRDGHWLALCDESELLAWFAIVDPLRDDAVAAVAALKAQGLQIHLLSGDASGAVAATAARLDIACWRGGASASEKLDYVRQLQRSGPVMMVGDGINDLPVMAAADVSVAMMEASDLSKTQADCALLTPHLGALPNLLEVARKSCGVIRQNLLWALMYNGLAIPLAAAALVPPYAAAIGMSLSSLLVVANSQRLARYQPRSGAGSANTLQWRMG